MKNNIESKSEKLEALETQATLESQPVEGKKRLAVSKKAVTIAIIIVLVVGVGVLAYLYKGLFIAATVNGSPISRLAVISELEKASGKSALDSLISQKLIDDEAQKKGISVSDDEIAAEVKNTEEQILAQGMTLEQALAAQGMTQDDLEKNIAIQKKLEKLLADKIQVTDDEVEQYITDNEITIPAGEEASYRDQIKDQLQQEKLSNEAATLIDSLQSQAKINYFVNY